ncbi:lysylphosphatidylglycerol synthase transmembrane domain-containing protein [Gymnodinialimonas hymeniacidonis]|uniref:lysylphosphatidylglycerol synthase transmembrane domain-containing protein n=1 Tax=Gymnodinialimonas hymeniacidonis TaxID=3126508 RepID=UPI0034C66FE3
MLRIGLSLVVLTLVIVLVDIDVAEVWALFVNANPVMAALSIALMLAQLLLTAIRWSLVNDALNIQLHRSVCLRLMCVGQFFNQCLPTSVGGDAIKIGVLVRGHGLPFKTATLSVVMDRLVGVSVLLCLAVFGWLFFITIRPDAVAGSVWLTGILVAAVIVCASIVLFLFPWIARSDARWTNWPALQATAVTSNSLALNWPTTVYIVVSSATVQGLIALSIFLASSALNIHLPPIAVILIPMILFVSILPFSFAGWGLREGAMVTGLALVGVAGHEAIAISVFHGLTQLIIGLPGAWITVTRTQIWPQADGS